MTSLMGQEVIGGLKPCLIGSSSRWCGVCWPIMLWVVLSYYVDVFWVFLFCFFLSYGITFGNNS